MKTICNRGTKSMLVTIRKNILLSMAVVMPVWAHAAVTLNNIVPLSQTASQTEVKLDFDGLPPAPQAYQVENPKRLVVDFAKARADLPTRFYSFKPESVASTYSVIDNAERTRIVFSMEGTASYATRREGNSLYLIMRPTAQAASAPPAATKPVAKAAAKPVAKPPVAKAVSKPITPPATVTAPVAVPAAVKAPVALQAPPTYQAPVYQKPVYQAPSYSEPVYVAPASPAPAPIVPVAPVVRPAVVANTASTLQSVDFKRGQKGAGDIILGLASKASADVKLEGSKVVVKLFGTKVPDNLRKRLDVNDFGTPAQSIESFNENGNGVIVVRTNGRFEHQFYQTDSKLVLTVKPPAENEKKTELTKNRTYSGDKLSLNIQDMEVRQVLSIIADFTNINLVASDSIKDKITVRLQNIPWDQALDIILKTKGLDKRQNGNVIMVAPAEELAKIEKTEIDKISQQEQLTPLQTEYIQLNYAKAENIINLLGGGTGGSATGGAASTAGARPSAGGQAGTSNNGLLSPRGLVSVDARTNTIIIQDTADRLDAIRDLINRIDVPVRQVMIEARVVRAFDNFGKEMGVRWGILSDGIASNNKLLVGGSETTLFDLRDPEVDTTTGAVSYTINRPSNLNVDMSASGAASRIGLGLLSIPHAMIDLELSAMQSEGKGEVVSTPKVLTMDNQKARIASGSQIPYSTASNEGTNVSFKDVVLSLEVTPTITPEGRVGMKLLVNNDSQAGAAPNGEIIVNTNSIETNVLVDDGQTIVLGGVFETINNNNVIKTPFLGDLPFIGKLFRRDTTVSEKRELLIFVTPRVAKANGTF